MDLNQILAVFNSQNIISFTFKILAIFFAAFYLLYAIVLAKQTQVMNNALEAKGSEIFFIISSLQIAAGLILLILAIFLV